MKIRTRAELRRLGMMGWAFRGCFTGAEAAPVAAETAGAKGAADVAGSTLAADAAATAGTEAALGSGLTASTGAGLGSLGELSAGGLGAGVETGGLGLTTGAGAGLTSTADLAAGGLGAGLATGGLGLQTEATGLGLGVGTPAVGAAEGGAAAGAVGGDAGAAGAAGVAAGEDAAGAAANAAGGLKNGSSSLSAAGQSFANEAPATTFSSPAPAGTPVGGAGVGDAAGAGAAGAGGELSEDELLAKVRAANAATAAGSSAPVTTPTIAQSLLDKLKANPLTAAALGVNVASQISQRNSAKQVPAQLKAIAAPASEASKSLLDQYKSGEINPSTKFEIDKWKQQQIAVTKNYYARAGTPNSTAAMHAIADIEAKAAAMTDQARQGLLTTGLNAAGMAAGPLTSAVEAQAAQDKEFAASQGSALNSLMLLQAMESGRTPAKAGV